MEFDICRNCKGSGIDADEYGNRFGFVPTPRYKLVVTGSFPFTRVPIKCRPCAGTGLISVGTPVADSLSEPR